MWLFVLLTLEELLLFRLVFHIRSCSCRYNSNTTGVTCGAGTSKPSKHLDFPRFLVGFVLLDLLFSVQCFVDQCVSLRPFSIGLLNKLFFF